MFFYGQPFSLILVMLFFVLAAILIATHNPYYVIPLFDGIFILGIYCFMMSHPTKINKGLKILYVHKHVFLKGFAVINQKQIGLKKESYECANAQIKEDLETILNSMPNGFIYTFVTHDAIIALMNKTEAVTSGKVAIKKLPYYETKDLSKIKKGIMNSHCTTCQKEFCGTKNNVTGKDMRRFYAVSIKCSK